MARIVTVEQAVSAIMLIAESRELMNTAQRREMARAVIKWIRKTDLSTSDLEHGASHMALQLAYRIGELERKIVQMEMRK